MRRGNQCAHLGCGMEGIANHHRLRARLEFSKEGVANSLVHKNPRAVGANLARRIEIREQSAGNGFVEICVLEDDQRGFSAKFKGHIF